MDNLGNDPSSPERTRMPVQDYAEKNCIGQLKALTDDIVSASRSQRRNQTNGNAENISGTAIEVPSKSTSLEQYGEEPLFPVKLFAMLEDAEIKNFTEVVSWGTDGTAFQVHQKQEFENRILLKYFKMTKYKSFTKQLQNYGFVWIRKGRDKGGYHSPSFSKTKDPTKCYRIYRKPKVCRSSYSSSSSSLDRIIGGSNGDGARGTIGPSRKCQQQGAVHDFDGGLPNGALSLDLAGGSLSSSSAQMGTGNNRSNQLLDAVPSAASSKTRSSAEATGVLADDIMPMLHQDSTAMPSRSRRRGIGGDTGPEYHSPNYGNTGMQEERLLEPFSWRGSRQPFHPKAESQVAGSSFLQSSNEALSSVSRPLSSPATSDSLEPRTIEEMVKESQDFFKRNRQY